MLKVYFFVSSTDGHPSTIQTIPYSTLPLPNKTLSLRAHRFLIHVCMRFTCMYVSHGCVSHIGLYPRLCQLSNDVIVDNAKRRTTLRISERVCVFVCARRKASPLEQEIFFSFNIIILYSACETVYFILFYFSPSFQKT